ncbi:hypothetical protein PINS_up023211 [Pythium insidiosum]|nr:hypothetical protein PINS_up023211 [Pythium insidiosum]
MFDARRASSRSSAEQLAELQLLTRVDQQQGEAVRSLSVLQEGDEQEGDEDATDEIRIEMTTTPPTATSFTALLAASRRLVGSASSPPPPSMPETIQPSADKRSLSTLSETTELETTTGPETDADRTPNDTREPLADRDQAFEDMLQQLPYDASFLALSISDIKPRNLLRLRTHWREDSDPHGASMKAAAISHVARSMTCAGSARCSQWTHCGFSSSDMKRKNVFARDHIGAASNLRAICARTGCRTHWRTALQC